MITFIGPRALHVEIPIYGEEVTEGDVTYRPVTGYVEGYHVNIARDDLTPELEAFEVTPGPNTPVNTWAGDSQIAVEWNEDGEPIAWRWLNTAFLVFDDEAAAQDALDGPLYSDVEE